MEWNPRERAEFLAAHDAQSRRRNAVTPRRTGDLLADVAAADDAVEASEAYWDECDRELLAARAAAGRYPNRQEGIELVELERARDRAWADRQAAVRNRDALVSRLDG